MDVLTVEATYENGVLKPAKPLELAEGQRVRMTIRTGPSRAEQSAGLLRWIGDPAAAEYFAMSPELDLEESP